MVKKHLISQLLLSLVLVVLVLKIAPAQTTKRDKGTFQRYPRTYWQKILQEIRAFGKKKKPPRKGFWLDTTGKDFPQNKSQFRQIWHQPPRSQGDSGTCWCFAATSFLESEIYRLTGQKVQLSVMYTVYWETLAKARRFVRERGHSFFGEGSEPNAVLRMWRQHGIVPLRFYSGKKPGQKYHHHTPMFREIKTYLAAVRRDQNWNENQVLSTVRAILDHYLGPVPTMITINNQKMTPYNYLRGLGIKLDDYLNLMSLMQCPYYQMVEYPVPDNWWHSQEYLNVPLANFMQVMHQAPRQGFSICLGGDTSEPGYQPGLAVIPSFDIPTAYIDENARQYRFSNHSTTDDHALHCIGWLAYKGWSWYLIKDSSSWNGSKHGYTFMREDYVKLKMMIMLVHKKAASQIWQRYQTKSAAAHSQPN